MAEAELVVQKVSDTGLIAEWNATHPSSPVRKGHCIVQVNGKGGAGKKLMDECMKKEVAREIEGERERARAREGEKKRWRE